MNFHPKMTKDSTDQNQPMILHETAEPMTNSVMPGEACRPACREKFCKLRDDENNQESHDDHGEEKDDVAGPSRGVGARSHARHTAAEAAADVEAIEPDIRGATTIREQLAKHPRSKCAHLPQKIDPPGFALESFDVIGGWRDNYRASPTATHESNGNNGFRPARGRPGGTLPDGRRLPQHRRIQAAPARGKGPARPSLTEKRSAYCHRADSPEGGQAADRDHSLTTSATRTTAFVR